MKNTLLAILFLYVCTSCSVMTFYQTYKTTAENGTTKPNSVEFQDQNCSVQYNLFSNGGKVSFSVYNKTDSDMVIDLTKTFFILNSTSRQYYQDRTFSVASNTISNSTNYNYLAKKTSTNSTSSSSTYHEQSQIIIPAKTRANVSEFSVVANRFISCDLAKFPSGRNIKKLSFTKDNSPFQFSNLISYTVNNTTTRFENRFFVTEIANYPSFDVLQRFDRNECGNYLDQPIYQLKDNTPDRFYFKYSRDE